MSVYGQGNIREKENIGIFILYKYIVIGFFTGSVFLFKGTRYERYKNTNGEGEGLATFGVQMCGT